MRKAIILILLLSLSLTTSAQRRNTRQQQPTQREQLQQRQRQLRQQQQANKKRQQELEQQVKVRMKDVEALGSEIADKQQVIDSLHLAIDTLQGNIAVLDSQLTVLRKELEERRQHYIKSVRYMYRNRNMQNQMIFVLSAKNFNQMYRRMRFMNEYTTYQRAQGEAVKQKSEQMEQKLAELNEARNKMNALLARGEEEQKRLEQKKEDQQKLVASLQREEQTVRRLITQQQQEEAALNKQIDRLIAEELERARKAEEERQRKLAEQRRREQEQLRQQQAANNNNNTSRRNSRNNTANTGRTTNTASNNRTANNNRTTNTASNNRTTPTYRNAEPDRQLSGSFASNKGRLPVPITGNYRVVRGFGAYTMAGVTLQSSGIHLEGQAGAQARCVFDGEVSRIFDPGNGIVVMVRHGRYISVYSGLSAVSVSMGQKVKTNQTLGTVGPSHTLLFRLQDWDKVLNPKSWLKRL